MIDYVIGSPRVSLSLFLKVSSVSNNLAEVAVILGFLLFVLALIALPFVDRWMVLSYCEGANLTVEQCMTLLEK